MAKFNGSMLGKISGKTGGTQFYPSSQGNIMRISPIPVNVWTPARQRARLRMNKAVKSWALVSFEMADRWNAFASEFKHTDKVGKELIYKGREIFIMINSNRLEINEPIILEPPQKVYPENFTSINVNIIHNSLLNTQYPLPDTQNVLPDTQYSIPDTNDIRLSFDPEIHKDTKFIIYATSDLRPGVNSIKPCWYKKIAVIDSTFLSGFSIVNEYKAVFKFLSLKSNRIAFFFRPVSAMSGFSLPGIEVKTAHKL